MTNNNFLSSFFKLSLITTLLFGSLLAQSYATNIFSDVIMKMNLEFTATEDETEITSTQSASMTVHNEQFSSIAFGKHQLDIKTTFYKWQDDAKEMDQILAEVEVQKMDATGHYHLIHSPSFVISRNQSAEVKLGTENGEDSIELKLQFEDFEPIEDDSAMLGEPVWLNWGDKETPTEVC